MVGWVSVQKAILRDYTTRFLLKFCIVFGGYGRQSLKMLLSYCVIAYVKHNTHKNNK